VACEQHAVANFNYLPGGQRPYCIDCDAEREELYQTMRRQGLRAIVWSGLGGIAGAIAGYGVGALVSSDSFVHTVSTDLGFLAGLALALAGSLSIAQKRQRPVG
jgi:hypothetical protein